MAADRGPPYPLIHLPPLRTVLRRAPRLRIDSSLSHSGMFDGGWWPRSRRIERELPGLIHALRPVIGPVLHVAVERSAWDEVPSRITVDGHVIRINCFSSSAHTMSVGGGHQDHFLLLVVPPRTRRGVALAALASAAGPGNSRSADRLLTEPAGVDRPPPVPPMPPEPTR
ncbi:DUF5994 family protein [Kitasatospora sp. MAP5-34]|uniref:DUF5994 family protein n=1 Tax=Kitasatospora sp. MAP5-34 TaxID=3035102 RepID=UPI0024771640|nr:DUF5994 family protein [Kitasatospora sp. MAP5-34]MDH6576473.1 hypothetical protein [Kitasatospora sp. MAP5-34]